VNARGFLRLVCVKADQAKERPHAFKDESYHIES
jgi:hypothetical protein